MSSGKRIAVMQPYFFPYAGYFRLFSQVDEFVLFDRVQFPRTGRVHRTEHEPGKWLTLPLVRQALEVQISDLVFAQGARAELDRRLAALPWLAAAKGGDADAIRAYLYSPLGGVVDFLEAGLRLVNSLLGIAVPIVRSSTLDIVPGLRGQERVLAVASARGATHYLNSPGGRALYQPEAFAAAGIELEFLPDYHGPHYHLLPDLVRGNAGAIATNLGVKR